MVQFFFCVPSLLRGSMSLVEGPARLRTVQTRFRLDRRIGFVGLSPLELPDCGCQKPIAWHSPLYSACNLRI